MGTGRKKSYVSNFPGSTFTSFGRRNGSRPIVDHLTSFLATNPDVSTEGVKPGEGTSSSASSLFSLSFFFYLSRASSAMVSKAEDAPSELSPRGAPICPLLSSSRSAAWLQPLAIASIFFLSLLIVFSRISPYFPAAGVRRLPPAQCDYSSGRWVPDESLPLRTYTEECPFLDPGFRCRQNGRRDDGYFKWRWLPDGCDLPRFNASDLMERTRNGRIVFVGDSIGRNHWESLVCLLARAVENQASIYEENGNPITKHKGFLSIRFSAYNLTVEYYRTPFLVTVGRSPANSPPVVKMGVRVDQLHWMSRQWAGADVLVFNAGHWWSRDKTLKLGCYFQEGDEVNIAMNVREAFRKSLQTWKRWVLQTVDPRRSVVFFRSFSPVHFSGGTWDKGGHCDLNTGPDTNVTAAEPEPWTNREILEAVEQINAANGRARFLNVTYMTQLRKDGHPSLHREPGTTIPYPQDCSHWCLPGVPDAWNELLYANLLRLGKR